MLPGLATGEPGAPPTSSCAAGGRACLSPGLRSWLRAGGSAHEGCARAHRYPLVQPGTVVSATATPVGTRDGDAAAALPWTLDVAADGQGAETVLYCRPAPGPTATVTVTAPDGACVEVEQDTDGWPMLVLWRDPRPGTNVLGVEPSTSRDAGRAQAERDGEVRVLPSGGEVRYRTVVRVRP